MAKWGHAILTFVSRPRTAPGSPKSCMKGARKQLTFDKPGDVVMTTGSGGNPSPIPSPKRSPRSVSIRMHDDDGSSDGGSPRVTSFDLPSSSSSSEKKQKAPPPEEIKFQFQLTQHYDQSTPPPNCTSNGNYDFDRTQETSTSTTCDDPRKDPQLVEIATRFVNDIIENAKVEAANRAKVKWERIVSINSFFWHCANHTVNLIQLVELNAGFLNFVFAQADSRAPPQGTSNDRGNLFIFCDKSCTLYSIKVLFRCSH